MREKFGLTQAEAAAVVMCTPRNWQQWEAGERKMHPGLWKLFLLETGKLQAVKNWEVAKAAAEQDYDPWVAGRLLGKYQQYQRWPKKEELQEWLNGFIAGCADVAEYSIWQKRLAEYADGRDPPDFLTSNFA